MVYLKAMLDKAFNNLGMVWCIVGIIDKKSKFITMVLTIILILAGIVAFALFFKSIDFFDNA